MTASLQQVASGLVHLTALTCIDLSYQQLTQSYFSIQSSFQLTLSLDFLALLLLQSVKLQQDSGKLRLQEPA